jgi:hypothetical protein
MDINHHRGHHNLVERKRTISIEIVKLNFIIKNLYTDKFNEFFVYLIVCP